MSFQRLPLSLFVFLALTLFLSLTPVPAAAQEGGAQPGADPGRLRVAPQVGGAAVRRAAPPPPTPLNVIVDSDLGVDDALALIWLLGQPADRVNPFGIVTVAGNTSRDNATDNALTVVKWLGKSQIPVIKGAAQPLAQPLSLTGWFLFGPDGLWFTGEHFDQSGLSADPVAFYCHAVATTPNLTILALGPLTNLAQAVTSPACAGANWSGVELIALGGASRGGNATPVAEYNFWQDPEAANIVLTSGLRVTVVPLEAFTMPTVTLKDVDKLAEKGNPAVRNLIPALRQFVQIQVDNGQPATLPDAVAAVYAVNRSIGAGQSALVKMVLPPGLARGQSIAAFTVSQRLQLIADDSELSNIALQVFTVPGFDLNAALGAILMREPDNAWYVTQARPDLLVKVVFPDLRK